MEDYQERVIEEKKELDKRIKKLIGFLISPEYTQLDWVESNTICRQSEIMQKYSNILNERIINFN